MKKISLILSSIVILMSACTPTGGSGACGSGVNLCFDLDGTTITMNAEWYDINPTRHRILWEETSGTYKNLELDLYGSLSASTYNIVTGPSNNGEAGFQYFIGGSPGANYQGTSGTVVVTSTADNKITGTFSGTVINASVSHNITNGKIDAVPHQ